MKMNRRLVLQGIGGALLGLPWLESVRPRAAWAQASSVPPFAEILCKRRSIAITMTSFAPQPALCVAPT